MSRVSAFAKLIGQRIYSRNKRNQHNFKETLLAIKKCAGPFISAPSNMRKR